MTAHEGNICFVSRESLCFPETKSRETFRFEGNKTDVSEGAVIIVLLYSINKINHNY